MALPINIKDLLNGNIVETERVEYKEGWNPDAIYRTVCAFANDFENIGGGYIIIGIECKDGKAVRPVKGIAANQLDLIQRQMIGFNNLLKPVYHPKVSIEKIDKKQILVIWVPGGSNRPYESPELITAKEKKYYYYIRKYSNSVKANQHEQQELISLANQVPFDDRANTNASLNDISLTLIREHLRITGSRLHDFSETLSKSDLLEQMNLLSGAKENLYPRNASLMLFSENPHKFFPYSQIDIVEFPKGAEDPEFTERSPITGPVQNQITKTIEFLKTNILKEKTIKQPDKAEASHIWNYPLAALEEAIANAIYHRDYQVREPVEIRIYPDSIVILNYGGPDRSIKHEAFIKGPIKPRRYRNRRLGDFLKELDLTEGKATGIPRIKKVLKENNSPEPVFEFDDDRTYFMVEFKIHPAFIIKPATKNTIEKPELSKTAEKILSLLKKHPDYSAKEIAAKIGITERGVQKHINKLKEFGVIKRVGSDKSGHWEAAGS